MLDIALLSAHRRGFASALYGPGVISRPIVNQQAQPVTLDVDYIMEDVSADTVPAVFLDQDIEMEDLSPPSSYVTPPPVWIYSTPLTDFQHYGPSFYFHQHALHSAIPSTRLTDPLTEGLLNTVIPTHLIPTIVITPPAYIPIVGFPVTPIPYKSLTTIWAETRNIHRVSYPIPSTPKGQQTTAQLISPPNSYDSETTLISGQPPKLMFEAGAPLPIINTSLPTMSGPSTIPLGAPSFTFQGAPPVVRDIYDTGSGIKRGVVKSRATPAEARASRVRLREIAEAREKEHQARSSVARASSRAAVEEEEMQFNVAH